MAQLRQAVQEVRGSDPLRLAAARFGVASSTLSDWENKASELPREDAFRTFTESVGGDSGERLWRLWLAAYQEAVANGNAVLPEQATDTSSRPSPAGAPKKRRIGRITRPGPILVTAIGVLLAALLGTALPRAAAPQISTAKPEATLTPADLPSPGAAGQGAIVTGTPVPSGATVGPGVTQTPSAGAVATTHPATQPTGVSPVPQVPCNTDEGADPGQVRRECGLALLFGDAVDLDSSGYGWDIVRTGLGPPWDIRLSATQVAAQPGTDAEMAMSPGGGAYCHEWFDNKVVSFAQLRPGEILCVRTDDDRVGVLEVLVVTQSGETPTGVKFLVTIFGRSST